MANSATPSAIRPPNDVASGLRGDDLLLEACQHSLRLSKGQIQTGDIGEIIRPIDLHDVGVPLLTISPDLHQPLCYWLGTRGWNGRYVWLGRRLMVSLEVAR
jgi:hypothetical protein